MATSPRAVYFFCCDPAKDPVAYLVYEAAQRLWNLQETGVQVDGYPVRMLEHGGGVFHFVQTGEVLSHDYDHFLPLLQAHFADFDFAGVVNWHEGANAPERIFTVHTTGDVPSGCYGPAHSGYTRNLILALEENRKALGLDDFSTTTEATHWSGIPYGGAPELIPQYPVPLVDVEVGSSPPSWSNETAAEVMARSIVQVFDRQEAGLRSLLCVGGIHFEQAFARALLSTEITPPVAVSHILANQWVVSGGYDADEAAQQKLQACVASILGGIDGIVYHDKLKGTYKDQLRRLGETLGVPAFKHKVLARPDDLPL